jgi:hypothetical protein
MSAHRLIIALSIGISILGIVCTNEKPVAGIEITNGNCVGTIYHSNGSVADGAVVRLIPRDYNPFSPADSLIDSTVTDRNGRFSFMVTQLRRYNVIAQKADVSCMDSIELIPNATIVVIDTLRESGFISGIVRLQTPDTANSIVILVMGTNVYVMPSDTSGNFATPLLAAGTYALRIFSTQSGYAVFDTIVTVEKGAETKLPVIFLPSANAPSVGDFSVTLDSLMMYATFVWSVSDTDSIVSYSLHRTSKKGNDSLIMVDKSLTSTTYDVLLYEGDTLTYQIAANGKNFKEGFRSRPLMVIPRQKVRWDQRILTQWAPLTGTDVWLFFDYTGNMFMANSDGIQEFDAIGNFLNSYDIPSSVYFNCYQSPQADEFGNIYFNESRGGRGKIIRFDADLNKHKELIFGDSNAVSPPTIWIATAKDGNLLVIEDSTGEIVGGDTINHFLRRITTYDSNFVKQDQSAIQAMSPLATVMRFGNTFVAEQWVSRIDQRNSVGWYDQKFSEVSAVKNFDYVKKYLPWKCTLQDFSFGGPNGLIFTYGSVDTNSSPDTVGYESFPMNPLSLFVVSTADKKLVARLLLPPLTTWRVYFDQSGNFYSLVAEKVGKYQTQVIYRYPMAPLFDVGAH